MRHVIKGRRKILDEYAAALKAEAKGIDSYYVQVCSAWSQYTRWDGREQCINNAARDVVGANG